MTVFIAIDDVIIMIQFVGTRSELVPFLPLSATLSYFPPALFSHIYKIRISDSMAKGLVPATLHIDITKSRWDQKTFSGRLRHFAAITDPRLTLVSTKQLEDAKCIVDNFKKGKVVDL